MGRSKALLLVAIVIAVILLSAIWYTQTYGPKPTPTVTPSPNPTSYLTPTPTPFPTPPTPNLTTPTFTVTIVNASYAVPTTYSIDPQTGAQITNPGYTVNRENITFVIRNQPEANAYYIRWTTPYMNNWNYLNTVAFNNATVSQSPDSETVWNMVGTPGQIRIYPTNQIAQGYSFQFDINAEVQYESGATIQFQVQALNGTPATYYEIFNAPTLFLGVASPWSQIESVTIP